MQAPIDIEKIRQGDLDMFREFFACFYPKLKALACRFVDEYTAEDLVQDVFASCWERRKEMDATNIRPFLYKWIQNSCLNHLKHLAVVEEYDARVRLAEERIAFLERMTDENEVFNRVAGKNLLEVIEASIQKLPPKCAQAFRLCYFHDMSHKEIAEVMHISRRTVEWHIRQAILFLRSDLRGILTLVFAIGHI
jgi:RNA polymerase sigma-70 factor (ECF subfamily)